MSEKIPHFQFAINICSVINKLDLINFFTKTSDSVPLKVRNVGENSSAISAISAIYISQIFSFFSSELFRNLGDIFQDLYIILIIPFVLTQTSPWLGDTISSSCPYITEANPVRHCPVSLTLHHRGVRNSPHTSTHYPVRRIILSADVVGLGQPWQEVWVFLFFIGQYKVLPQC